MAHIETAVKAAWKAIDNERSYATGLTQKLVQIPSVNPKFVRDPAQNRESAVQDLVESEHCRNRQHPLRPPGINTINVGVICGGAGLGADGFPVIMTNPAIIPDVDVVVIDLDYKFLPNQTKEYVRCEFEAFVYHFCQQDLWLQENPIKAGWELGGLHFAPMVIRADHPIAQSLLNRRTQLGGKPKVSMIAVTDAAHTTPARGSTR
ncbi:hypothetical protein IVB30_32295 [Bradyrhizobium sp. 200]|uniref:hypothetical protein n=1 Tax=Bradyrhizobium sp. 200 TaxID=2782665 RepID=UPI0020003A64|nr:hypothetical protein [Bradyrhizobium sp. 200]UPJ47847.1 hypothetical protein IVB30_32295 [Bradyrhizobium sp. 200]